MVGLQSYSCFEANMSKGWRVFALGMFCGFLYKLLFKECLCFGASIPKPSNSLVPLESYTNFNPSVLRYE